MDSTEPMPVARSADSSSFQSAFGNPRTRRLFFCLLLALATIASYNSVTRAPFLNFDDSVYVTDNLQVRAGLSWKTVAWAFRTPKALDWHPITWLSYALDCQMFGLNPAGYHTVNILLHTANALLLFLILESATGLAWRSLGVAALFALHPINVESVAWVSERKTVLSMFFFLLALAAYGWYARRPGVGRYLVVTLAYVLGLMSKAQVITFPFALLLLDYWPLERVAGPDRVEGEGANRGECFRSLLWEKVPWFALSAASAVITMKTGGQAFSYMLEPNAALSKFPLWVRVANAAISYGKYLGKAFWPVNLAVVYPHPGLAISVPAAVLSALAIIALTVVAVILRRQRPFFVGWFWFLGTLVPMIGLIQIGVHSMADRYAYIPLLGIFVIVCWAAAEGIRAWHIPTVVVAAGTVAILLGLGIALHRQVGYWGDNVTLWTHTRQITAVNFTTEDNVATALISQGRVEEAVPYLQRAQSLRPDDPLSMINLATYQQMHGNYQAAIDGYARVVRFTRTPYLLANARINSGYAHLSLHQYDRAKQDFEAARSEQPANFAAYRGLGLAGQRSGDLGGAIQQYKRSVELEPSAVGYLLLAQALEIARQTEASRAAQERAGRMTRDLNDDLATVKQLLTN
jgi:protein O-mannosyl-transferase